MQKNQIFLKNIGNIVRRAAQIRGQNHQAGSLNCQAPARAGPLSVPGVALSKAFSHLQGRHPVPACLQGRCQPLVPLSQQLEMQRMLGLFLGTQAATCSNQYVFWGKSRRASLSVVANRKRTESGLGKSLIRELLKIPEQRLYPPLQEKLLVEQPPLKSLCCKF